MTRPSPFARGFGAVRRAPSVLLVEIGWRWVFGGIATALVAWATMLFLRSITVSKGDEFLLRSLNLSLMSYALRELFQHKWGVLLRLSLVVGTCLSLLWIVTASVARTATTRVLLEDSARQYGEQRETRANVRTVAGIQLVRVALLWVGVAAYFFCAVIAARLTTAADESHPGAFVTLFLCMFLVAAAVLSFFNWLLLLAPIFALRDGLSFADATIAGWELTRTRAGGLIGLNLGHLAVRLVWFVFMSGVAAVPLGFAQVLPAWLIFLAIFAATLIYLAVADLLFVARYAGYIKIAEQEMHPEPEPASPQPGPEPVYVAPAMAESGTPDLPVPSEPPTS